jgi:hypothetical protein
MTIRETTWADPDVLAVVADGWEEASPPGESTADAVLLLEDAGVPIGVGSWEPVAEWGAIETVVLRRGYRGFARCYALWTALEAAIRAAGYRRWLVAVPRGSRWARLLAHHGGTRYAVTAQAEAWTGSLA